MRCPMLGKKVRVDDKGACKEKKCNVEECEHKK